MDNWLSEILVQFVTRSQVDFEIGDSLSPTERFCHCEFLGSDIRGLSSQNKYIPDNGIERHSHLNGKFRIFEPQVPNFSAWSLNTRSLNPETSLNESHAFSPGFLTRLYFHFTLLQCQWLSHIGCVGRSHALLFCHSAVTHLLYWRNWNSQNAHCVCLTSEQSSCKV